MLIAVRCDAEASVPGRIVVGVLNGNLWLGGDGRKAVSRRRDTHGLAMPIHERDIVKERIRID